jgi:hypothetical protein
VQDDSGNQSIPVESASDGLKAQKQESIAPAVM